MPNLNSEEGQEILNNIQDNLSDQDSNKVENHKDKGNNKKKSKDPKDLLDEIEKASKPDDDDPFSEKEMIKKFQKADEGRSKFGVGIPSKPTRKTSVSLHGTENPPSWDAIEANPKDHL